MAPVVETYSPVGLGIEMSSMWMNGNRPFQTMRLFVLGTGLVLSKLLLALTNVGNWFQPIC